MRRNKKKWDKNKGLSIRHAQQLTQPMEQHYLFIKKSQRRLEETWHNTLPMKTLDRCVDVSHLIHMTHYQTCWLDVHFHSVHLHSIFKYSECMKNWKVCNPFFFGCLLWMLWISFLKIQYLYNRLKHMRKRWDSYAWKCMQYGMCNHDFKN